MNDEQHTVSELRGLMRQFVAERQWEPFHTPKNLATSIAIETAELMEHFQWLTPEQSLQLCSDPQAMREIRHEMADVLAYLLALANAMEVDLSTALVEKMRLNAEKYPAPPA
jgi:NTP pyrophosphatase (non-canonical NTP hydrolase)